MLIKRIAKFFSYLIIFSFLWSCCHRIPPINPYQTEITPALKSYIYIRNTVAHEGLGVEIGDFTGTGGVVIYDKEKYILSAAHVCFPQFFAPPHMEELGIENFTNSLSILDYKGTEIQGEIINFDLEKDICLIKPLQDIEGGVELARNEPVIGDEIHIMAGPYGYHSPGVIPIFDGYFSGYDDDGWAIYSIHIGPGSSGGLLLNEKDRLIGVVSAGYIFDMNIAIGTSLTDVKNFIASSE